MDYVESIKGEFWRKEMQPVIGMKYLVDNGYITPTTYGNTGKVQGYDLSEFDGAPEEQGAAFSRGSGFACLLGTVLYNL